MRGNNLLYLVGGLLVGAAGGFFAGKMFYGKKYQEQYEQDVKDMEEYYKAHDEYSGNCFFEDGDEINPVDEESKNSADSLEEKRAIRNKLKENYEKTTNYAAMYQMKKDAALTEDELRDLNSPMDLAEEESPEEDDISDETETEEMHDYHQKNKDRSPRIISETALGDLPAHIENEVLFFYFEDQVLATEEDEVINDVELFVGDALTKYDFIDNDEKIIFVQNFQHDKVYEIQKLFCSYGSVDEG